MPNQWSEQDWKVIRGAASYISQHRDYPDWLQKGIQRWQDRALVYRDLIDPPCSVAAAEYILSLYVAALLRAEK